MVLNPETYDCCTASGGGLMPEVKSICQNEDHTTDFFGLKAKADCGWLTDEEAGDLLAKKLWNISDLFAGKDEPAGYSEKGQKTNADMVTIFIRETAADMCPVDSPELFYKQGYILDINRREAVIHCHTKEGAGNALSTMKQLLIKREEGYCLPCVHITDWPTIEVRGLSATFAWYAGYGRIGFDMQLWGFGEWIEFLNICSDYKINHINLCMYGFWPFVFPEYPETVFQGIRMKVWNVESQNWVEIEYMHPNVAAEFLPALIEYGHLLGIRFFAYIGLNSYSGGYACKHKDKRMKMPEGEQYINDFDSLCLSEQTTIEYLRASVRRIAGMGFDGFDFEESEEAFWYCNCENCKKTFWKGANTPEEALHNANTALLGIVHDEIKKAKPECVVGIRAWRQPPLRRSDELIAQMKESIPKDVVLFWAPGHYTPESEFKKWADAFGRERIWGRDTEAMGFAAGFGRLVRPFRWNGLRCAEESITQYIEEDIRQHVGSQKAGVKGINGYQFEWYGFFMAFFAHAYYGWGGKKEAESFYAYSLRAVFGELWEDILFVLKNMLTIHESQLSVFPAEFPFARNKVEEKDIPAIEKAIAMYPVLTEKLEAVMKAVQKEERLRTFWPHFKKLLVSVQRSRVIYDMAKASIRYDKAETEQEKMQFIREIYDLNEQEFAIVRENYFDVNPVNEAGVLSCMIPYHELKRVLTNLLYPDRKNDTPIYPGVEALGWLWC